MKAISKVLGFLIYWLVGKEEEGEGNVEIVLGLDWLRIGIFLDVDLEAWMKLFEGWKGEKSGLKTWKEFAVCNGKVGWIFEKNWNHCIWIFGFLGWWRKLGPNGSAH